MKIKASILNRKAISLVLLLSLALVMLYVPFSLALGSSKRVDVLIAFKKQPGLSEQALVKRNGGSIKYTYNIVPAIAANIPEAAIANLSRNPNVERIELDGKVHAVDTELDNTWGIKRIGAGTVHDGGNKGTGVKVAVIDSGIDYTHPELRDRYKGGYDFVNRDHYPMDDNGHGTHVAGTVAAVDDNYGVIGAAPEVSIYAIKVLDSSGSGYWSDIIAGVEWAANNGIQITNNSYGSGSNPGGTVENAFIAAEQKGVLHIAAAGNSGNTAGKGDNVGYPANYNSVVAVAATDASDRRAYFSSTGAQVELAAPGVNIRSTIPGEGYADYNGTSMASPHVAGTAALVIAAGVTDSNGNHLINDEVRQVMNNTATDLGDAGRDTKYGHGLVDAVKAVAAVTPSEPPAPAVKVNISTDKSNYVIGTDTSVTLAAVVTDEYDKPIDGLSPSAFTTILGATNVSETTTFTATGVAGTYSANLDISGLAEGTYNVSVTVTKTTATGNIEGTGSVSFSIGQVSVNPTAIVQSINYTTEGGKSGNLHLMITVLVVDDKNNLVSGANVGLNLTWDGSPVSSYTGTTGSDGKVTFKYNNAPSGTYTSTITDVIAAGLKWDEVTPANSFTK